MALTIEGIEIRPHWYTVIVGDRFARDLTVEEALGAVASALLTPHPMFLRTYEESMAWGRRYEGWKDPVALLR